MTLALGATFTKKGILSGTRPDISNTIKATEDLIVKHGLIIDDKYILDERVYWTQDVDPKRIEVVMMPMEMIVKRAA